MKSNSQESVRTLFNLPKDEKIFDDFGCSIFDVISYYGRLYITENFICFNSNILGFKSKCVIPFHDIKSIQKESTNKIEITTINNKYTFSSFNNRDIAYKRIKKICKAYIDKIRNNVNETNKLNKMFNIELSDSDNENDDKLSQNRNSLSTSIINNKSLNNSSSSIQKPSNLNDSLNNSKINFPQSQDNLNTGEDIQFIVTDPNKSYEMIKVVVNLPPNEFFDKFLSGDKEETSTTSFFQWIGEHYDIKIGKWEKEEGNSQENINNNNNTSIYKRNISFRENLAGILFIDHSDVVKTQTLTITDGNKYVIRGKASSIGTPFCDCYTIEEIIEIYPYMNNTKSALRVSIYNEFVKNTFFKSTIISSTKNHYQNEMDKWVEFIKLKGNTVEGYVPPKIKKVPHENANYKMLHGIEKEGKSASKFEVLKEIIKEIASFPEIKNILYIIFLFFIIIFLYYIIHCQVVQYKLLSLNCETLKEVNYKLDIILNKTKNN